MFRVLKSVGGAIARLGTNQAVLDRSDGTIHYRDLDGDVVQTAVAYVPPAPDPEPRELYLMFAVDHTGTPVVLQVLKDTTGAAGTRVVTRDDVGRYSINVPLLAGERPFADQLLWDEGPQCVKALDQDEAGDLRFEVENAAGATYDLGPSSGPILMRFVIADVP